MKQLPISLFILFIFSLTSCTDSLEKEVALSYPDGTPMKVYHFKWKGNTKDIQKQTLYFAGGQEQAVEELQNGKKHGLCIYYYENGNKWIEERYENGVKNGKFTVWYASGKKNYSGEFTNGLASGTWDFWDENGDKNKTINY